jgi:hypothetical protein
MSEIKSDPIQTRIDELLSKRKELEAQFMEELSIALMPIDTALRELQYVKQAMAGQQATAPAYTVQKPKRTNPTPMGVSPMSNPPPVTMQRPVAEVELSPKSGTPIQTNVGILKQKLGR